MRWFVAFNLLLFFAVALIAITGLRRYTGLMKKWGPSTLLFLLALAAARLLFPVDFYAAHSIKSRKILVAVMFFLEENGRALLAVWGIGTAAVLVIDACVLVRAHRQARRYAAVDQPWAAQIAQRLGVKCPVVVSPDVETPYVSGFFRHTVYLPDQELSGRELELILSHELAHIRSHDAQIKLAFGLLSAVLWWVPGVYLFRSELDTILELRCDQKVTERMEPAGRAAYAEMLLNMMKGGKKRRRPALSVDESNVLGRPDVMRQRFEVLLENMDRPPRRINFAVVCCAAALFAGSFFVMIQPYSDPPMEDLSDPEYTYEIYGPGDPLPDDVDSTFIIKYPDGSYELTIDFGYAGFISQSDIDSGRYDNIPIYEGIK